MEDERTPDIDEMTEAWLRGEDVSEWGVWTAWELDVDTDEEADDDEDDA